MADLIDATGINYDVDSKILFEEFQSVFAGMKFMDKSGRRVQITRYEIYSQDYLNFENVLKIEVASEISLVIVDSTRYRGNYGEKSPRTYKVAKDIEEFYDRKRIFAKIDTKSVSEMIDSDIFEKFAANKMGFIELHKLVDRIGAPFTLLRSGRNAFNVTKDIIFERAVEKELGIVREVNNGDLYLISNYHAKSIRHWEPGKLMSMNLLNDHGIWVEKSRR